MDNANQTPTFTEFPQKAADGRRRSPLSIVLGIVFLLLALAWALPVAAYFAHADVKYYLDPVLEMPSPQIRLMVWTVMGSAIGLLLFGVGLLGSANWARIGGIVFLLLQLGAVLASLYVATHGFADPDGNTIVLLDSSAFVTEDAAGTTTATPPNWGLIGMLGMSAWNALLVVLLLLARRRQSA